MKFKVGGLTPEEDAARFRTARTAAGPDFVLCADANQGWTPTEAVRFARLVEDLDLHWFEEPCIWSNDRRAMRDVRFAGGVRVCAGQSEFSAGGCRDLMVEGAIDFCNFDSSWSGGATEWRRVAAAAVAFDVAMAHHEEPQIASHLLASIPHGTFLEVFSAERDPIWWNLVANRPADRRREDDAARRGPGSGGSSTRTTSRRIGSRRAREPAAGAARAGLGGEGRRRHRCRRGHRRGGRACIRRTAARAWRRSICPRKAAQAARRLAPGRGARRIRRRHRRRRGATRRSCGGRRTPSARSSRSLHLAAVLHRRHDIREIDEADWDAPGGREPEGDVLPQPRLRRAPAHGRARVARSSTSARRAGGRAASAARSSTTRRRAASSR